MRIDAHAHAQPQDYLKILLDSGRFEVERADEERLIVKDRGSRFLTVLPRMSNPDQWVVDMGAAGIDAQIISLPAPNVYFKQGQEAVDLAVLTNDFLAEVVQRHPGQFKALASVPLTADIDSAINELVRCMDQLGMPGFLIGGNIDGAPIDDPRFDPLFEEANRRGAVMFVHPMVPPGTETMGQYGLTPLVGFAFDTTLAVARLVFSNFFGRFLGINVLVGYLGGAIPYLSGRLDAGFEAYPESQASQRAPSEVIERLFLDTVSAQPAALRCAIETVGSEQVLFGSDYPQVTANVTSGIDTIERAVGRRERNRILGDNAAKLFGFE
jgi:aminocarboxymuconate-semialdehyde decarboxylase